MALVPGSIAFVGFNADGNDSLAFVALAALPAGMTIFFSDREWTGSAFNSGEGGWSWTAPATDVAAGTVITISDISDQDGVPISANIGTAAGGSGLGADNEIVYAYVGPDANTPTAFLTAVANDTFTVDGGTLAGTGLTVGVDALQFNGVDPDTDVAAFNGSRGDQADFSAYAAIINNPANWITQDGTGDQSADGTRRTRRSRPRASRSAAPATTSAASPSSTRRRPCRVRSLLRWRPMPLPCRG